MAEQNTEQPNQEFDYDKEFDALVSKREGEKPAPTESEDTQTDAPASEAADQKQPPADDSAGEKKQEEKKQPAALSDDELLALVPEDRREAVKARLEAEHETQRRLDNNNRSLAGRISAYQKRYEEAVGKRPAEAAKAASKEEHDDWKTFATDYPDIAKAIEGK